MEGDTVTLQDILFSSRWVLMKETVIGRHLQQGSSSLLLNGSRGSTCLTRSSKQWGQGGHNENPDGCISFLTLFIIMVLCTG